MTMMFSDDKGPPPIRGTFGVVGSAQRGCQSIVHIRALPPFPVEQSRRFALPWVLPGCLSVPLQPLLGVIFRGDWLSFRPNVSVQQPVDREAVMRTDFRTTHWSVVLAAADEGSGASDEALERLCHAYCYPLYAHVRRHHVCAAGSGPGGASLCRLNRGPKINEN